MPSARRRRVAAIVPVYHPRYLREALESVFAQTRPADEVIVIDDGAPDRAALAAAVAPFGNRITVMTQPNRGAGAARNAGLRAARADLVALLDADDRWMPRYLEQQLAVLAEHPDADVVFSDGLVVGRTALAGQAFMRSCRSRPPVTLERLLAQRVTVLLSAVVATRRALLAVGGFDETLRRGQDFDLWLRMAREGSRFVCNRTVLVERRVHDDNLSGTTVDEQERPLRILEKQLRTMALSRRERAAAERRIRELRAALAREHGKELLRQGHFDAARCQLSLSQSERGAWKVRLALVGLCVAPGLVRRVLLTRRNAPAQQRAPSAAAAATPGGVR